MSCRTKSELEAENAELKSLVAELERETRSLREMRDMVLEGDEWCQRKLKITDDAHKAVIDETIRLHEEKPKIIRAARSENARNAAKKRHALPLPTEAALKKEFLERMQQRAPDTRPTPVYKTMAEAYAGGKKHWRRIRTQVEK